VPKGFGKLLKSLRGQTSLRVLAARTSYDYSYLAKVERGDRAPTIELAEQCDQALGSNGELTALLRRRPAQLPPATGQFVGRREELAQLDAAVARTQPEGSPTVVVITGPPGVGKTGLALHWAHGAVDQYPDGQLYVDLRGYAPTEVAARLPETVLEEFLTALGIPDMPQGLERRTALYRSVLATQQVLVVLDNAADVEQIEPLLPGSASCTVLVTSRRALPELAVRVSATGIRLEPMSAQESATLLRTVIPDQETDALDRLADLCGRLPLALRIAGERIVGRRHYTVTDLLEELDDEQRRLDALRAGRGESAAMRAVISWSYQALPADQARMFRLLGLLRGTHVSAGAAAALAGVPVAAGRDILDELAGTHLVEVTNRDRYEQHNLLHAYAAEQAVHDEPGPEQARAVLRMTDWYVHTVRSVGQSLAPGRNVPLELAQPVDGVRPSVFTDDLAALAWCDREAPNFAAVINLAVRQGQADPRLSHELWTAAWQLAIVLWDWLQIRRPLALWVETHEAALLAASLAGSAQAGAWVSTNLAEALHQQGNHERSRQCFEHALQVRRDAGDLYGQAWTLAGLAFLSVDEKDPRATVEYAGEARRLFRQLGDPEGEAEVLLAVADTRQLSTEDELDAADRDIRAALRLFEQVESAYDRKARAWLKLAVVHKARGEHSQALDEIDHALSACRRGGDRRGEADSLAVQAEVLRELGRPEQAREALIAAWELYTMLDVPRANEILEDIRAARPAT
jgi:tetratricopeptide (TPR) repeat protein